MYPNPSARFVEVETWHSRRNVAVVDCFSYGIRNEVFLALSVFFCACLYH